MRRDRANFPVDSAGMVEARFLRGGGGGHKATILEFRWPGWADGTAINAGRLHTSEKSPVVTNVTRANRPITYRGIKLHPLTLSHASDAVWRFSDLVAGLRAATQNGWSEGG